MNSESELSFDINVTANLAGELVISVLVGLLFGLLGFGLAMLILVQVFTSSTFFSYMTMVYDYRWSFYLNVLLIPVVAAVISFAILRPLVDRVRLRKSWLTLTCLNAAISVLLLLWSQDILVSPTMWLNDLVRPLVGYTPPLMLVLLLLIFLGLAGMGILLAPQKRRMKIIALAISASSFATLYLISFLVYDIGFQLSQSGN